jgi:hypothetical protein
MTKLLEQAIEAVRRLPADSQDDIARTILHLAGSEVEPEPVVNAGEKLHRRPEKKYING